jgi:hypothetical protein
MLCFALVALLAWGAGAASARTVVGVEVLMVSTDLAAGWEPKCGDPSLNGLVTFIQEGMDDCGGRFTNSISCCMSWSNFDVATQCTFETVYREGGTLHGTIGDMELTKMDGACVLVPKDGFVAEITGGTGPFEGCTGKGEGAALLSSSACGGDNMQIMGLVADLNFPREKFCPSGRK